MPPALWMSGSPFWMNSSALMVSKTKHKAAPPSVTPPMTTSASGLMVTTLGLGHLGSTSLKFHSRSQRRQHLLQKPWHLEQLS